MELIKERQVNPVEGNDAESFFTREAIYGKFSIILLLVIIATVIPHYLKIANPSETVTVEFIVHAILYLGWYVIFCIQANLVSIKKVEVHRKLGLLSLGLFVLLMMSGIGMLIDTMVSNDLSKLSLIFGILHTIIFFAGFFLLGIYFRKDLHIHKRLMLLASLSMISASITRVAYLPFIPIDGTAVTLLSTYGLLIVPLIIDRVKFGRVHSVLKWSIPVYIVSQILFIAIMPSLEIAKVIAFPFY